MRKEVKFNRVLVDGPGGTGKTFSFMKAMIYWQLNDDAGDMPNDRNSQVRFFLITSHVARQRTSLPLTTS